MGSMKKVMGVAAAGIVAALALASSAAAVEAIPGEGGVAPVSPGACVFSVTPAASQTFPVVVTVAGTAPVGVTVTVVGAGGTFSFPGISVPSSNTAITVNYTYGNKNAYTTVCANSLGDIVVRVRAEAATTKLAFTGSNSNTQTYVLVGVAAMSERTMADHRHRVLHGLRRVGV